MIQVFLIRHSYTEGNLKKRYIGKTDEPLCEEGIALLKEKSYPAAERIFVSPMLRCRQSAELIYPGRMHEVIEELRECDFGIFENKNYCELSGTKAYQEWIDSMGTLPFPQGESREEFRRRTLKGFEAAISACRRDGIEKAAFVIHGGNIMNIMETYAFPIGEYYDYQIKNGEGYELCIADDVTGEPWNASGLPFWRSKMALPPGAIDRTSYHVCRKNYKKLFTEE